jgi:alpha-L-fucosidase
MLKPNYDSYFQFMKNQVRELLTNYPNVAALWFDGYWDHDQDTIPFNWRMEEFYRYIHQLKPTCLIGNNHHITPIEGEDFQMFERDLPGENKAGLSGQDISQLPLEMCQTMNGMWGYKVSDTDYKSADELITLLVRAAGKGSNLLLNIGPQPNGELPAAALERLKAIGEWMRVNGHSVYEAHRTALGEQPWGTTTERKDTLFLHILDREAKSVEIPLEQRPLSVGKYEWKYDKKTRRLTIELPEHADAVDCIVEVIRARISK